MVIQAVSLKSPCGKYLSCRSSDDTLEFDQPDLDPSCKFFMVPLGAGRTCLKGPNGKFVDLHGDRFLCDGITTGVGFLFSDITLQLSSGKYFSNVVDGNTITASGIPTSLIIKPTSFQSFAVSTPLCVPTITYGDGVFVEDHYQQGRNYLALKKSGSTIDIVFSLPYSVDEERGGTVEVLLNHMRDKTITGGVINIQLNGEPIAIKFVPPTKFFTENVLSLPLSSLSGENKLSIALSDGFKGTYCLSDSALVFKDEEGYLRQENSLDALGSSPGSSYNNGELEDDLRTGHPYLSLKGRSSWSKVTFAIRKEMLDEGNCIIKIQHRRGSRTSIDIHLNGELLEDHYKDIPTDSFGTSTLALHSSRLQRRNELFIKPRGGKYYISDVNIDIVSLLPDVTEENFKTYVKDWILLQRRNIGQLTKIPQEDPAAWKFVSEAPYWFFLPFLPVSPREVSVLFNHYNMEFVSVAFEIRDLNDHARDFHQELVSTDLPRKNALRHAYWTALLSRRFGLPFALDLSAAHDEAHVDLAIEGPFDHVTDKINNSLGALLGSRTPRAKDLQGVVDAAWENGELGFAKDFREMDSEQTASVFWQQPLDMMAKKYQVKPRFSQSESDMLKRMGVKEPDVAVIH
ncbi:hypothetical protein CEP52_016437 [Fusarium oligoseptatum]|uniref:Uncharacterized protein n=1 Tax=Fusarium oligoseptatum TaxID=2604345 RepID=A0A428S3M4_9HYPO|nr:hypothetical protein CEP52_016437 [Fusarium oligoseptatum]